MSFDYSYDHAQALDDLLARCERKVFGSGRPWTGTYLYTDSNGDEWYVEMPKSYTRGIWQWQHSETEGEPDGEGGWTTSDNRHGTGSGLLDCLVQIECEFSLEAA